MQVKARTRASVSFIVSPFSVVITPLEMHRIVSSSNPITAPFEARTTEDVDDSRVHVTNRTLSVFVRGEVHGDSPGMSGNLRVAVAHRTETEATTEVRDRVHQSVILYLFEHVGEDWNHQLEAGHSVHHDRLVPCQRNREW